MKIYLVRHGEAEHNVDKLRMAHTHDSQHALTPLGLKQVDQTGRFLGERLGGRTKVFASPYRRTMETAEAIVKQLPPDHTFLQNLLLREWELGNLYDAESRTEQNKKEFKAAGQLFFRFQNGESLADVYQRAAMFVLTKVQPLVTNDAADNVVLVTHAAFIHMLLGFWMDWPIEEFHGFSPVENACVIQVESSNDVYHYEKIYVPELATL